MEYIHFLNFLVAKVLFYFYVGEAMGFVGFNNLIVSNTYIFNAYIGEVNGDQGFDIINVDNVAIFNIGDHILLY